MFVFILGFANIFWNSRYLHAYIILSLTCYSYSLSEIMYHELIVQIVKLCMPQQYYVHTVTTITLTVMKIIKHAADKIVTDGYVGNSCIPQLCF